MQKHMHSDGLYYYIITPQSWNR